MDNYQTNQPGQCAGDAAKVPWAKGQLQNPAGTIAPATPVAQAQALLDADKAHQALACDQVLSLTVARPHFRPALNQLAELVHVWMKHQGFDQSSKSEMIALEHTELSERLEAIRNNVPEGAKGCESEEVADAFIRLLHYCGKYNIDLGKAFHDKMLANYRRPFRHNKAF